MTRVPLENLGQAGLNRDTPAFSVSHDSFTDGRNLRPFDGSLQGVWRFDPDTDFVWSATRAAGDPLSVAANGIYAATQVTPTGSDFYNILAVVRNADDSDTVQPMVVNENNLSNRAIIDLPTSEPITYTDRYGMDLITFNEVVVLNAGTHRPLYFSQGIETGGDFNILPNWFPDTQAGDPVYARKMSHWNGRLVAMNFTGGNRGASTVAFSTPITSLDSLLAVEWQISTANDASDDIAIDTPGPILDGGVLGNNFIVYKDDSVLIYNAVTASPFIIPDVLFADDGILSSRCFADIGNGQHFVIGNRGAYIHDGSVNKKNVSRGRVEESLLQELDFTRKDRAFVFHNATDKEVWCCFSAIGNTGDGCNRAYVYCYLLDAWYIRDLDPNIVSMTSTQIGGEIEVFGSSLASASLQQLSKTEYVPNGFVRFSQQDAGDAIFTKKISEMYPKCERSVRLGLMGSDNLGTTITFTDSDLQRFDPATSRKIDWRIPNDRYYDFEVVMDEGVNPEIAGLELEVELRGRR